MVISPLYLVRLLSEDIPSEAYGGYSSRGIIGTPTNVLDVNQEMIMVGDIVKVTKESGSWWSNLVIERDTCEEMQYYTVCGMATITLEKLTAEHKVERVVPYVHLNQPYRRHINHIALPKKYMDICWDFVDGKWTKIHEN